MSSARATISRAREEQEASVHWRMRAECQPESLYATPEWLDAWVSDDLDSTARCRSVCRVCQVRYECSSEVLTDIAFIDQDGTMGGTTSAQRAWLRANPDLAHEVAQECRELGVDTDELGAWHEDNGPSAIPAGDVHLTPKQVASQWGVSIEVWRRWLAERGLVGKGGGGGERVHIRAYEIVAQMLSDANGGWVPRSEMVDAVMEDVPVAAVEHTAKYHSRGVRGGMDNLVAGVLQSLGRSGEIEQTVVGRSAMVRSTV